MPDTAPDPKQIFHEVDAYYHAAAIREVMAADPRIEHNSYTAFGDRQMISVMMPKNHPLAQGLNAVNFGQHMAEFLEAHGIKFDQQDIKVGEHFTQVHSGIGTGKFVPNGEPFYYVEMEVPREQFDRAKELMSGVIDHGDNGLNPEQNKRASRYPEPPSFEGNRRLSKALENYTNHESPETLEQLKTAKQYQQVSQKIESAQRKQITANPQEYLDGKPLPSLLRQSMLDEWGDLEDPNKPVEAKNISINLKRDRPAVLDDTYNAALKTMTSEARQQFFDLNSYNDITAALKGFNKQERGTIENSPVFEKYRNTTRLLEQLDGVPASDIKGIAQAINDYQNPLKAADSSPLAQTIRRKSAAGEMVRMETQKGMGIGFTGTVEELNTIADELKGQGIKTSRNFAGEQQILRVRTDSMSDFIFDHVPKDVSIQEMPKISSFTNQAPGHLIMSVETTTPKPNISKTDTGPTPHIDAPQTDASHVRGAAAPGAVFGGWNTIKSISEGDVTGALIGAADTATNGAQLFMKATAPMMKRLPVAGHIITALDLGHQVQRAPEGHKLEAAAENTATLAGGIATATAFGAAVGSGAFLAGVGTTATTAATAIGGGAVAVAAAPVVATGAVIAGVGAAGAYIGHGSYKIVADSIDTSNIKKTEATRFQDPGMLHEDLRYKNVAEPHKPLMSDYQHLYAIKGRIAEHLPNRRIDGKDVESQFHEIDFTKPENQQAYNQAISKELVEQRNLQTKNSYTFAFLTSNRQIDAYHNAGSEINILKSAQTELQHFEKRADEYHQAKAVQNAKRAVDALAADGKVTDKIAPGTGVDAIQTASANIPTPAKTSSTQISR